MAINWGQMYSQGSSYQPQAKKQKKWKYTAKKGDNLWKIAKNLGVSPSEILKQNKVNKIRPGMTLNIYDTSYNKFNAAQQAKARKRRKKARFDEDIALPVPDVTYDTAPTEQFRQEWETRFGYGGPKRANQPKTYLPLMPVSGGQTQLPKGRQGSGSRLYQYAQEYGIVSPGAERVNVDDVKRALDRGDLPIFITAYAAEQLGLDPNLLLKWYDIGVTGNLIRRTAGGSPPDNRPIASGGGGYGSGGGGRRGGGSGGSSTPSPQDAGMGFGGPYSQGGGGYGSAYPQMSRGYSPTGRRIAAGGTGLINWRI